MLKRLFIYCGVLTLLFITTTTAPALGIKQVITFSSILLVLTIFYSQILEGDIFFRTSNGIELQYLLITSCISALQIGFWGINSFTSFINIWILPVIILLYFKKIDLNTRKGIRYIILFFFIVECGLAIYERSINFNFFSPDFIKELIDNPYYKPEAWEFRSTALWGHPLMNANIVSIILAFILISDMPFWQKISFYALGMFAILAFNARGAILIWLGLSALFFVKTLYQSKFSYRFAFFVVTPIFILLIGNKLTNSMWGGRLIHQEKVLDESAKARIDAYNVLKELKGSDYLYGANNKRIITENSYINICLKYGFIFGLLLIIAQFRIIFKQLKPFSFFNGFILFISFIGVASLNNNMQQSSAFLFFILCYSAFFKPTSCKNEINSQFSLRLDRHERKNSIVVL